MWTVAADYRCLAARQLARNSPHKQTGAPASRRSKPCEEGPLVRILQKFGNGIASECALSMRMIYDDLISPRIGDRGGFVRGVCRSLRLHFIPHRRHAAFLRCVSVQDFCWVRNSRIPTITCRHSWRCHFSHRDQGFDTFGRSCFSRARRQLFLAADAIPSEGAEFASSGKVGWCRRMIHQGSVWTGPSCTCRLSSTKKALLRGRGCPKREKAALAR